MSKPVAPELIEAAVAEALTAPAPHHTRPVRFVWMQDPAKRLALLDGMKAKWRADLAGDGRTPRSVESRVSRGAILYDAPELVIPFMVPDGAHSYPDAERTAAEHTMFTVAVGAAVQALLVALAVRGVGSCWIGSTIFAADLVRDGLGLPADWEPLGAIAIGYPEEGSVPPGPRDPVPTDDLLMREVSLHASAVDVLTGWDAPDPTQDTLRHAVLAFLAARPDGCLRECVPGHVTASALVLDHSSTRTVLTLHPRFGRWLQLGGHCEATDADIVSRRTARSDRGVRYRRSSHRTIARGTARAPGHLLARRADPSSRHAIHRTRATRCRNRLQR